MRPLQRRFGINDTAVLQQGTSTSLGPAPRPELAQDTLTMLQAFTAKSSALPLPAILLGPTLNKYCPVTDAHC